MFAKSNEGACLCRNVESFKARQKHPGTGELHRFHCGAAVHWIYLQNISFFRNDDLGLREGVYLKWSGFVDYVD